MAVEISRTHRLGRPKTRQVVEDIAASLAQKLNLRYGWEGDRLVFRRQGINGHIDVADEAVHVFIKKSRLLPVSDALIRREVEAVMDQYLR